VKVNVDLQLIDLDDELIEVPTGKEDPKTEPLLLKNILINALITEQPNSGIAGNEKFERYNLARTIKQGHDIELTAENIALLKDLVAKNYTPLVVGDVWNILEGKRK